jgi:hypothetical protein
MASFIFMFHGRIVGEAPDKGMSGAISQNFGGWMVVGMFPENPNTRDQTPEKPLGRGTLRFATEPPGSTRHASFEVRLNGKTTEIVAVGDGAPTLPASAIKQGAFAIVQREKCHLPYVSGYRGLEAASACS